MKALFTLSTNLIPEMEFERQFMAASGTTLDQARFSMAFLGALLSGFLIRFIPGTKGVLKLQFSSIVSWSCAVTLTCVPLACECNQQRIHSYLILIRLCK
jgi:hypothetical protein